MCLQQIKSKIKGGALHRQNLKGDLKNGEKQKQVLQPKPFEEGSW